MTAGRSRGTARTSRTLGANNGGTEAGATRDVPSWTRTRRQHVHLRVAGATDENKLASRNFHQVA